jgi:hypothetical protein
MTPETQKDSTRKNRLKTDTRQKWDVIMAGRFWADPQLELPSYFHIHEQEDSHQGYPHRRAAAALANAVPICL